MNVHDRLLIEAMGNLGMPFSPIFTMITPIFPFRAPSAKHNQLPSTHCMTLTSTILAFRSVLMWEEEPRKATGMF